MNINICKNELLNMYRNSNISIKKNLNKNKNNNNKCCLNYLAFLWICSCLIFILAEADIVMASNVFYTLSNPNANDNINSNALFADGNLIIDKEGDNPLPANIKRVYGKDDRDHDNKDISGVNVNIKTTGDNILEVIAAQSVKNPVYNNTLIIEGGKFDVVKGAFSEEGDAISNIVKIKNGTFTKNIISAASDKGKVENNKIFIDGNITLDVNNVYIYASKNKDKNKGEAINNRIVLGPNFSLSTNNDTRLYLQGYNSAKNHSGNTLEVYSKNIHTYKVSDFDNYYFILPENIKNGDTIIYSTRPINLSNTNIGLAMKSKAKLNKGDIITLMDKVKEDNNDSYNIVEITPQDLSYNTDIYSYNVTETTLTRTNDTTKYNVDVSIDENKLKMTVEDVQKVNNNDNRNTNNTVLKEEAKAVFEANLVPNALLSQNLNMIDNVDLITNKRKSDKFTESSVGTFGNVSGTSFKLNS